MSKTKKTETVTLSVVEGVNIDVARKLRVVASIKGMSLAAYRRELYEKAIKNIKSGDTLNGLLGNVIPEDLTQEVKL